MIAWYDQESSVGRSVIAWYDPESSVGRSVIAWYDQESSVGRSVIAWYDQESSVGRSGILQQWDIMDSVAEMNHVLRSLAMQAVEHCDAELLQLLTLYV